MRLKSGGLHLGYHTHYVVDGGTHRIILTVLVTPSEVTDNLPMLDLLWHVRFRYHLRPRQVTGDTKYGTIENIKTIEDQGIRAYVPLPDWEHMTSYYGPSKFVYDAEHDLYICPNGQPLRLSRMEYQAEKAEYRADAAACNACPLKAQCTPSDLGRQVHRAFHASYLERVRGYHQTFAYQKAMRKRKVWVEPLFAEAKDWHGMRRFRLRRLWRVNCEALVIAAGHNLQQLLRKRGWGRRPFPTEAVGGFCQNSSPFLAERSHFWYADLTILTERGTLTHELPHCAAPSPQKRAKKTKLGYPTFFCAQCKHTFNERTGTPFNYLEFPTDIVLLAVVWRLRYRLSLRDVAEMFLERGFAFTHEAIRDWEMRFAPLIAEQLRTKRRGLAGRSWYVDETYIKVHGKWCYLYRAIDSDGNLVDSRLSEKRNMEAAKQFFQQAVGVVGHVPDQVTTDGHTSYPRAIRETMNSSVQHRTNKYLNNRLEQDHRGIKQRYYPMRGFGSFEAAARFCSAFDELRNYFRPRSTMKGVVSLLQQRQAFLQRLAVLKALIQPAS